MAPECSVARNLGFLPNLHHHHNFVCMDNDSSDSSAWNKEVEANMAQHRLVTTYDHRARLSCVERMVGQAWELVSRTTSRVEIAPQAAVPQREGAVG